MKKFKNLIKTVSKQAIMCILILSMVFMLSACGGSGDADDKYAGKWNSVMGEMAGITLTGEEVKGFAFDLQSSGKAVLTVDGETENGKWRSENDTVIITISGTEMTGVVEDDKIVFDNMLDMGIKMTFAKEGSESSKPENFLPEADKKMIGTWKSDKVTDILGGPTDAYPADGLKLEFTAEHSVNIDLNGEVNQTSWSLVGDTMGILDDDTIDLNWDVKDDGIGVNYKINDEYYIFHCVKH